MSEVLGELEKLFAREPDFVICEKNFSVLIWKMKYFRAVLDALERAPALVSDLRDELGISAGEVREILEELRRQGKVERAPSGFYYLREVRA